MAKMLVLSVRQAAQALEVAERTVRKKVAAEQIASRVGEDGFIKIPLSALKKFLAADRYAAIKARLENGEAPFPAAAECKACKVKAQVAAAKSKKGKK